MSMDGSTWSMPRKTPVNGIEGIKNIRTYFVDLKSCVPIKSGQQHYLNTHATQLYVPDRHYWFTQAVCGVLEYLEPMDAEWCTEVLEEAISTHGKPEIFNTDQGSQFTSILFTNTLKKHEIKIPMDGKGRAIDNVCIERLWRSLKYEYVYLDPANGGVELYKGVLKYFEFYNDEWFHQNLDYKKHQKRFSLTKAMQREKTNLAL